MYVQFRAMTLLALLKQIVAAVFHAMVIVTIVVGALVAWQIATNPFG
jgi:hypothetical protein